VDGGTTRAGTGATGDMPGGPGPEAPCGVAPRRRAGGSGVDARPPVALAGGAAAGRRVAASGTIVVGLPPPRDPPLARSLDRPAFGSTRVWFDPRLVRPAFGSTRVWFDPRLDRQSAV